MVNIVKYMQGYVKIKVSGYSPERFMNLCSNHNILLWEIENHKEYYTMNISIRGYFSMKPMLKKTKTRAVILERYGLPFFMQKIKKRKIFVIGLLGSLLFLILMSQFIWAVEFTGNTQLTDEVLLAFLEEHNVTYGTPKYKLDIGQLEKEIREAYPLITWTSMRLVGTRLYVQIKENTHLGGEAEQTPLEGSDLTAVKDGVIVDMITRRGVPQVKIGDEVHAGDILVSGSIPIYNEDATIRYYDVCEADADIYLKCSYAVYEKVNAPYSTKVYTGNTKSVYFFQGFDKEYKFMPGRVKYLKSDCVAEKKQVKLFDNLYLPFYFGKYTYREYMLEERKRSALEGKQILESRLRKILLTLEEKGVQILEKNVKIENSMDIYTLQGELVVIEKTGKSIPTVTKQIPLSTEEEETGQYYGE